MQVVYMYVCVCTYVLCFCVGNNMHELFLQNYGLFKRGKVHCINFSVPEVKILILLSYFIILGTLSLVNFTVSIKNTSLFLDDVYRYFACQLSGINPECEVIRQHFEKHLKPELNGATSFTLGLIPWVYLLFIIQGQDVKRLLQRITLCYNRASAKVLPLKF